MKLRALKHFYGDGVQTRRGQLFETNKPRALELIAKGYAEVDVSPDKMVAAPQNKLLSPEDRAAPFEVRQTGGQTGAGKQQSSSRADQPQRKRPSKSLKGDAE